MEFLPAALEIQETPPSPVGRAVAWTIMAVCAMAVLWASLSTVDPRSAVLLSIVTYNKC